MFIANLLMTVSSAMSLSLCMYIKASPFSLSSSIVERRRDFRIFIALKHRSAEHDVSGSVTAMRSKLRTFGYRCGVPHNEYERNKSQLIHYLAVYDCKLLNFKFCILSNNSSIIECVYLADCITYY